MTAIHWACKRGNESIVRLLLLWKANPNKRDYYRKTPIYYAIESDNSDIVSRLIINGARVDDPYHSYTALAKSKKVSMLIKKAKQVRNEEMIKYVDGVH